jgi:predicted TIM-barrel fold metal-dependent hydrolase
MSVDSNLAIPIVDVDSHVAEPVDLWTSRLSSAKWGDKIPHVEWDDVADEFRWKVGDIWLSAVGEYCSAGWPEPFPSHPPTLQEADPACWDPAARVQRLDEWGIQAQVLYPNVIAFDTMAFVEQLGPDMALACVQAYNDFLAEFANSAPGRFIPLMMLPFWDPQACAAEIARASELGHKGLLFGALLERIGLKNISDPMWYPVLDAAQERDLSVNFHVGVSIRPQEGSIKGWSVRTKTALEKRTDRKKFISRTTQSHLSLLQAATEIIFNGVTARYPTLKFVSVESGFGYWPYMLDHLDWYWMSSGAAEEFPDAELPSESWRRQFFATFWFERSSVPMLDAFQDNLMFETDFPHETSLPAANQNPGEYAAATMQGVDPVVARKVLYENAARLYRLDDI